MKNPQISSQVTFQPKFWEKVEAATSQDLHLVIIGTKPDIIKQAPLVLELKKQKKLILLGHTGQHYEEKLNEDAEKVFGIRPDFNLNIRGTLAQKIGQIIIRLGEVIAELKRRGKNVIPYVHGDTTTAGAAATAAYMNLVAVVHVEAGLRTFSPLKKVFVEALRNFSFDHYYEQLLNQDNWVKGSVEPFPEQFNTRIAGPATGIHNAPTAVNRDNLLAEGFREDRIFVSGNSVVDSVNFALKRKSRILQKYPQLRDGFIRFAIHRRENVSSYHRFLTIFEALEDLVRQGKTVLWLSHNLNKQAIKNFGLTARLAALREQCPNFLFSDSLWVYDDNILALSKALVNVTDSGSEQEEANVLGVPSVTVRFGSDRPETVWAGSNIVAPPLSKEFLLKVIKGAENNQRMRQCPQLYGTAVSQKIVKIVDKVLAQEGSLFHWAHQHYGFDKHRFWRGGECDQL